MGNKCEKVMETNRGKCADASSRGTRIIIPNGKELRFTRAADAMAWLRAHTGLDERGLI